MSGLRVDLTGLKFNRLSVIKFLCMHGNHSVWECLCRCGNLVRVRGNNLKTKHTQSCGCLNIEQKLNLENKYQVHGHTKNFSKSPTYQSWRCMRERCLYPSNASYRHYGARGITVCLEWASFNRFLFDMGERPLGKTLDRINPYLGYAAENCRWATRKEQDQNRRKKPGYGG